MIYSDHFTKDKKNGTSSLDRYTNFGDFNLDILTPVFDEKYLYVGLVLIVDEEFKSNEV